MSTPTSPRPSPAHEACQVPDHQIVELLRDALRGIGEQLSDIRTNQRAVQDQLLELTAAEERTHTEIFGRLHALEMRDATPQGITLARIMPYTKYAWPIVVVLVILWRDATPSTKRKALTAAGLDVEAGASWQAVPSSTWTHQSPGHQR